MLAISCGNEEKESKSTFQGIEKTSTRKRQDARGGFFHAIFFIFLMGLGSGWDPILRNLFRQQARIR